MKAPVPYLARLARQAAGQAALRPPRQLFAGDISLPARSPAGPGTVLAEEPGPAGVLSPSGANEERAAPAATAWSRGQDTGMERPPGLAGGPAVPAAQPVPVTDFPGTPAPARPEPAAGIPAAPGGPDAPWPPRAAPRPPRTARPGLPPGAAAGPGDPVAARPGPPRVVAADPRDPAGCRPAAPLPGPGSRPASPAQPADDTAGTRPPRLRASAPRAGTADLPGATGPVSPADETDGQAGPVARAGTWPPVGRGPAVPADSRPGPPAARGTARRMGAGSAEGGTGAGGVRAGAAEGNTGTGGAEGSGGPGTPADPAAARHLMPPPASDPRPSAAPASGPGEPRDTGRSQVTIGTIDVTVIPPAPVTRPAPPRASVPRVRSRPGSLLAASAGADRRRDGLRRWYGTAQG